MDVGTLIRSARERAGLTQAALAVRARTSAPTISAYEHGSRQPRGDVLLRLLDAAGVEPVLVPTSTGNARYVDRYCDALADHVRHHPDVLERARTELDRMPPGNHLRAWRSILDAGPAAVVAVLTSRDPDARGLKADNPFARLARRPADVRAEVPVEAPPSWDFRGKVLTSGFVPGFTVPVRRIRTTIWNGRIRHASGSLRFRVPPQEERAGFAFASRTAAAPAKDPIAPGDEAPG